MILEGFLRDSCGILEGLSRILGDSQGFYQDFLRFFEIL